MHNIFQTTSANIVLSLNELNAYDGSRQYEDIAIDLGNNQTKYIDIRRRLIDTALQTNPMHVYWDAPGYVRNLESGLLAAWQRFLSGAEPDIIEAMDTSIGTYDHILESNPSDRVRRHDEL